MFTTLPLELFVCREVRDVFSPRFIGSYDASSARTGNRAVFFLARGFQYAATPFLHHRYPRLRHVRCVHNLPLLYNPTSHACLPTVSLITCDLGVTLEITGGVSATALAYIFPAACFLKLTSSRDLRTTVPAYACVAFGVLVMVLSLALALGKAWTPAGEARICV
jgi:hypothetical protein